MNSSNFARSLLGKQYTGFHYCNLEITKNPSSLFSVGLVNDNLFEWEICFEGPVDTLYEVIFLNQGGLYCSILSFPIDYPNMPPEMRFKTSMWHPNSSFSNKESLLEWSGLHLDFAPSWK